MELPHLAPTLRLAAQLSWQPVAVEDQTQLVAIIRLLGAVALLPIPLAQPNLRAAMEREVPAAIMPAAAAVAREPVPTAALPA